MIKKKVGKFIGKSRAHIANKFAFSIPTNTFAWPWVILPVSIKLITSLGKVNNLK